MIPTQLTTMLALAHQATLRMPRDSMPTNGYQMGGQTCSHQTLPEPHLRKKKNNSASTTLNTSIMEISQYPQVMQC